MIELLKVLACMPFLLYSCYSDIKTRRVSNDVWFMMFGVGFIFIMYDLMTYGLPYLMRNVLSFLFIFAFVYILFQLGAFGGADAKILMVISLIIPTFPTIEIGSTSLPVNGVPFINLFAFSVFGNSVILTVIVPIGLFLYNLIKNPSESLKRPHYMFIGYLTPISKLQKGHFRMLDSYSRTKDGVDFRFTRSGTEITSEVISELKKLQQEGKVKDGVWITPGLPFMIPITAGFLTAVIFGDLIFYITMQFMLM
ncbi:A24 family peptidase C-terminal domain-containing protein [Methanolobus bombayensis]|uniref:A24 family peptidase C-terminal domain-containing protein n=1 Tax=Methanolobus bombayensis TaxID=38023 RepID=UPI001AE6B7A4|nr:A24 family peptidase C-terminal domain-containing protein [Methanolobus bombayensis]MBP1910577.1 preflagellin peptidase FlaK [Methanolobus bombayensis]